MSRPAVRRKNRRFTSENPEQQSSLRHATRQTILPACCAARKMWVTGFDSCGALRTCGQNKCRFLQRAHLAYPLQAPFRTSSALSDIANSSERDWLNGCCETRMGTGQLVQQYSSPKVRLPNRSVHPPAATLHAPAPPRRSMRYCC